MSDLVFFGNKALLDLPKTAFLSSRRIPPDQVLKCYDWATNQRDAGTCVISGFHSALEKDVLRFLLKGRQPLIVVLARRFYGRTPQDWAEAVIRGLHVQRRPGKRKHNPPAQPLHHRPCRPRGSRRSHPRRKLGKSHCTASAR